MTNNEDQKTIPLSSDITEYDFTCLHIPKELRTKILFHMVTQKTLRKVSDCYPPHPTVGEVGSMMAAAVIAEGLLRAAQVTSSIYRYTGGAIGICLKDNNEVVMLYSPNGIRFLDNADGINLSNMAENLLIDEQEDGTYVPTKLASVVARRVHDAIMNDGYQALLEWANTNLAQCILGSRVGFNLLTIPMTARQLDMDFEPTIEFMDGIDEYAQAANSNPGLFDLIVSASLLDMFESEQHHDETRLLN